LEENTMLRIHETAIELVREVMPVIREIERSDPDLGRQMRRAVMSTPLNIAEGSEQAGKRRGMHYRIALGSARETWSARRAAEAAGYIGAPDDDLRRKFDAVIGTLHRCLFKRP
jgi:four helix bundle protein